MTEAAPETDRRCLYCGLPIEGGLLAYCSRTCYTYALLGGEPPLRASRRIASGDVRPADSDPSLRHLIPRPVRRATLRRMTRPARLPPVAMIHRARSYTLTPFERDTVKRLAHAIEADKQRKGGKRAEKKMGGQSSLAGNVVGFGGELAFCRLFNVCPDLDVRAQAGTFDATLPNGMRIDVKTTMPDNPNLVVIPSKAKGECDAYVLMECSATVKGRFTYVGFALAADVLGRGRRADLGHGETIIIERANLDHGLPL